MGSRNGSYKDLLDHPILSRKEQRETLERVALGDKQAKEKMILHNVKLAHRMATSSNSSLPFDDKFQAGF